ncbi:MULTISPECIES: rod-binding protein [Campylobacter]|uniref:Rod-binding protein n=1 Tax=Campylobacter vicugnae TaxID=1660076 RepID=A0ABZ2E8Z4_9BACT|nr:MULTISPECIES: rod-binding protein [unclassified Campylobacter]ARR03567.1 putative flagellar protein FlgJ [Campylobacter sp. RM12175]MCR8689527.1 rod-binding protein [Campylobacter sp. RM9264]MCR8701573.1 rod-binding protein [Campylobacter sp. RM12176]
MRVDTSAALNAYNASSTQNLGKIKPVDDVALKEQTDAFEAFLVKEVLDIALKNENPLFPEDPGDKIYNSMYNDAMSRALSGGFGFSQMLYDFLKERA